MAINVFTMAAHSAEESGGVSPYIVGSGALVLLLALLLVVLTIGGGREHS